MRGDLELIRFLLARGATPNTECAYYRSSSSNALTCSTSTSTSTTTSSRPRDLHLVPGETPLEWLAGESGPDALAFGALLLEHNADPTHVNSDSFSTRTTGPYTSLRKAVLLRNTPFVRLLLGDRAAEASEPEVTAGDCHAFVNGVVGEASAPVKYSRKRTAKLLELTGPLNAAVQSSSDDPQLVRLLVEAGAPTSSLQPIMRVLTPESPHENQLPYDLCTPAQVAVLCGYPHVLECLLNAGATIAPHRSSSEDSTYESTSSQKSARVFALDSVLYELCTRHASNEQLVLQLLEILVDHFLGPHGSRITFSERNTRFREGCAQLVRALDWQRPDNGETVAHVTVSKGLNQVLCRLIRLGANTRLSTFTVADVMSERCIANPNDPLTWNYFSSIRSNSSASVRTQTLNVPIEASNVSNAAIKRPRDDRYWESRRALADRLGAKLRGRSAFGAAIDGGNVRAAFIMTEAGHRLPVDVRDYYEYSASAYYRRRMERSGRGFHDWFVESVSSPPTLLDASRRAIREQIALASASTMATDNAISSVTPDTRVVPPTAGGPLVSYAIQELPLPTALKKYVDYRDLEAYL